MSQTPEQRRQYMEWLMREIKVEAQRAKQYERVGPAKDRDVIDDYAVRKKSSQK